MSQQSAYAFVNLGCGLRGQGRVPALFGDWQEVRVDVDAGVEPDLVADMTDLSAIRTGSIDAVWASHCIEHLYRHEVDLALAEIHRILSPEGFACLVVPDLQTIAQHIASDRLLETVYTSPAGPISAHDIVFGFGRDVARGQTHMAHRTGFTPGAMNESLSQAKFGQFMIFRRPNLEIWALAHKTGWRTQTERDALVQALGL